MNNQFLDAAIEYASKGLAVFPIKPRSALKRWKKGSTYRSSATQEAKNATQEWTILAVGGGVKR